LIKLLVKVNPGSSKSEILEVKDGRLRIKVAAAPERGKANEALIAFLSEKLGCAKNQIKIISGEKGRLKTLALPDSSEKSLADYSGATGKI